jgi:hypothetical protein
MVCGHTTEWTVLLLSVNGVLLPSGLWRLRNDGSSTENRFACLRSLTPSVNLTQNCHVSASEDKYQMLCFQNVLNLLLIELYANKCVRYNRNFQTAFADGFFQERSMIWDFYFWYVLLHSILRRQLFSNVSDGPPYQRASVSCALEECFPMECWELNCKWERIFVLLLFNFEFKNSWVRSWFCWYVSADLCFKLRARL